MGDKCNFDRRALSFAAREAGCPLDHCPCGTHDVDHTCSRDHDETPENGLGHDPYFGEA